MTYAPAATQRSVLRNRPLVALLVAETLSTTGSQMTWLALPWFLLVTSGAKQMGLVIAAEALGYAVFGIPSGALLARLGSRRTMRLCDAFRGPLMLLVPVLHWEGQLTLPRLAAIAFVLGAAGTPYMAAQRMVVAEILDEDQQLVERANALLQGASRITMLAGPALAGVLIVAVGAPVVLLIDAASYVVAVVLVTAFVPAGRVPAADETEDAAGLLAGVRYLARDPLLRGWSTALIVADAAASVIFVTIPVLVVAHYGGNAELAGALFATWAVGAVVGNVLAYRSDRVGGLQQAVPLVFLQALPFWALAAPLPAAALAAALGVSGFANGLVNPTLHSMLTLRPPAAIRAKTLTATSTASSLGMPLALAGAAAAFPVFGSRHVVAVAAAGQLLGMMYAAKVTLAHLARERTA